MAKNPSGWETQLIDLAKKVYLPSIRVSLFVVYFWFGILKVIGTSPANPLVNDLLHRTIPFLSFEQFIIGFSIFEMIIGLLFLLAKFDRLALVLVFIHIILTAGPLVLLPEVTWQSMMTPTLEGQYIIKNLLIIAGAITIAAHLKPRLNHSA